MKNYILAFASVLLLASAIFIQASGDKTLTASRSYVAPADFAGWASLFK
jgi:hypothetical protein